MNKVNAEDELEGGKGIVGPGQGKKLLQIFKAWLISIPLGGRRNKRAYLIFVGRVSIGVGSSH
ncbi:unnamed protein product [Prunus armeniaca]